MIINSAEHLLYSEQGVHAPRARMTVEKNLQEYLFQTHEVATDRTTVISLNADDAYEMAQWIIRQVQRGRT